MEKDPIDPTLHIRSEEERTIITFLIQILVVIDGEPWGDSDFFKKQLEYIEKGYETGPYNKNRICKAYEMYVRQESPVDRLKEFLKDWKERKKEIKEELKESVKILDSEFHLHQQEMQEQSSEAFKSFSPN